MNLSEIQDDLNLLHQNLQNALVDYLQIRQIGTHTAIVKRILQRAIEDITNINLSLTKVQTPIRTNKRSKVTKKQAEMVAHQNQQVFDDNVKEQVQEGQQSQSHKPLLLQPQSRAQKLTTEQPANEAKVQKSCMLCYNCDSTGLDLGKLLNTGKENYVHELCLHNVANKGICNPEIYQQKECDICSHGGAFHNCTNCEKWYHYPCLMKQQDQNGMIECKCPPENIFSNYSNQRLGRNNNILARIPSYRSQPYNNKDLYDNIIHK